MNIKILVGMSVLLSSCATYVPPVDRNVDNTQMVSKPFGQTWQLATEWFANNNVPIKNIVKDSGLIATDYSLGADDSFIDCGTLGAMEAFTDKNVNLNFIAKEASGGTTDVRLNVFGTGRVSSTDLYGNSTGGTKAIDCKTTGKLEGELFSYLKQ